MEWNALYWWYLSEDTCFSLLRAAFLFPHNEKEKKPGVVIRMEVVDNQPFVRAHVLTSNRIISLNPINIYIFCRVRCAPMSCAPICKTERAYTYNYNHLTSRRIVRGLTVDFPWTYKQPFRAICFCSCSLLNVTHYAGPPTSTELLTNKLFLVCSDGYVTFREYLQLATASNLFSSNWINVRG